MTNIDIVDIITVVSTGQIDDQLGHLTETIERRQQALKAVKIASLSPGDQVKIVNCSPKYVQGFIVTIVSVSGSPAPGRRKNRPIQVEFTDVDHTLLNWRANGRRSWTKVIGLTEDMVEPI